MPPGGCTLLARELACASCWAWSDLEFRTKAKLAITAELMKLAADSNAGLAGKNKVLTRAVAPLSGRVRPVGEVVSNFVDHETRKASDPRCAIR